MNANRIIEAAKNSTTNREVLSRLENMGWAAEYAEPGYTTPESGVGIYFANWSDVGPPEERDGTMGRVANLLEKAGAASEWEDEWSTCSECGRAVRTQGDSYSWTPSYFLGDGELMCPRCVFEGKNDNPQEIADKLRVGSGISVSVCGEKWTLDPFTRAYLECALRSSHDESDPSGGEPLDKNYTLDDFAPEALGRAIADCRVFQEANADDIYNADYAPGSGEWSNAERAGHDFWLTRNGHGAGFWDRGLREIGERLDKATTTAGPRDAYLGDDRRIYFA